MKRLTLGIAAAALACTATFGMASAQQYGYPNQYRYPNQQRHYRNGQRASVHGVITAVNGNQVTIRLENLADYQNGNNGGYYNNNGYYNNGNYNNGYYNNGYNGGLRYNNGRGGRQITINDQPALDRQMSGRVSVGRFVKCDGYWQNGVFYATVMR